MKLSFKRSCLSVGLILGLTVGLSSCSSSTSTDSGTTAVTDVTDLPQATSPVEEGAGSASVSHLSNASLFLAETGMALGTTGEDFFDEDSSLAGCEMVNMTKHAIGSAVQGDLIQCYVANSIAASDLDGFDDGEYHVADLIFPDDFEEDEGGGGGPSKIKFKVAKDESGAITEFEMFACDGTTQQMYLQQTIDGNDFSMTSINTHDSEVFSYGDSVTVNGTLDESGAFVDELDGESTPKTVQMSFTNSSEFEGQENDFFGVLTYEQYSDESRLTGHMQGSHTFQFGDEEPMDCTFQNTIYGASQLLDGNVDGEEYDIGLLAVGDGAVTGQTVGGCGGDSWTDSYTEAWFGDDDSITEENDFVEVVADAELEEAAEPTISFSEAQTMDCDGEVAEFTIDFTEIGPEPLDACTALELNHDHIDCWQIIQPAPHDS